MLTLIRREFCALKEEHSRVCLQLQEQSAHIQQLKDQNALLKAQKSASTSSQTAINIGLDDGTILINGNNNSNSDELKLQIENLTQEIAKKDNEMLTLVSD